jgi:predicted alpha/beta superfamily hydrolase
MQRTLRIRCLLALVFVAFSCWLATAYWLGRETPDPTVRQRSMRSNVLGEMRGYQIHLPDGYARSPDKRYPVIYVLDGGSQSAHTAVSSAVMARIGAMPDVIVIGIPSGKMRARDYTPPGMRLDIDEADSPAGQADRFLAFLQRELVPQVEREFRANGERVLAGNSRAGLFVVYALSTEPTLFRAYIANSPALWRHDAAMVRKLDRFLRAHRDLRAALFLSLGSAENAKMTKAYRETIAVLQRAAPSGLRWKAYRTPGATHAGNAQKATPLALQWACPVDEAIPLPSGG